MPDDKVQSNGNVTVWVVPAVGIVNYLSPTAAEINAGIDITDALAWDGTTFPTANESNDVDDRSLRDKGNATSRGFAQFEFSPNLFRPKDIKDVSSDYGKAYQFFKTPRTTFYVVTRVLQAVEGVATVASAGQWISVFRFVNDAFIDDTEGEDSYKYSISTLPQGEVTVYTQVKNATSIVLTPGTMALSVGTPKILAKAVLATHVVNQTVNWVTSNAAAAVVSPNGVVTRVAAGTANITATHPSSLAVSNTIAVTVT